MDYRISVKSKATGQSSFLPKLWTSKSKAFEFARSWLKAFPNSVVKVFTEDKKLIAEIGE